MAVRGEHYKMKLKLSVMAGLLLLISPAIFALDLKEAYARAQQNDPNWQANVLQYQSDQLNLGIASGNLLPTVTLSGNVTRKNQSTDPQLVSLTPQVPLPVRWRLLHVSLYFAGMPGKVISRSKPRSN